MGWLHAAGGLAGAGTRDGLVCLGIAAHCCPGTSLLDPVASVSPSDLSSVIVQIKLLYMAAGS